MYSASVALPMALYEYVYDTCYRAAVFVIHVRHTSVTDCG